MSHQPPVVILARPQMAENIGSAARAMMNCGLSDLRLVNPRDGWPNEAALPMAAGGAEIIRNAQLFDSVAAASHDVSLVLAASARRRDLPIRDADPRTASSLVVEHNGQAALLFGPEASGLDNDEVAQADILVTAALNPDYPSLNLAQAVLLLAWEWRVAKLAADKHAATATPAGPPPSAIAERDYFFQRLEQALDDGGFFTSPEMAPTVKRNIRAMFNRAAPTSQEISTLHGVIQALTKQRKSPDKSG